ncbi:MAG: hypothetical protein IJI92_04645 [Erysipelotrichaceae bacterium]|nr:hypothetical protein [Erysipelotrichaceae bacterium]
MKTRIISSNRDLIVKIIENETCCKARYDLSPSFNCHIGDYTITRDGFILSDVSNNIFPLLGSLGLCDHPFPKIRPLENDIYYSSQQHDGSSLSKLFYIIYSRQHLLNRSLNKAKAFFIDRKLINALHSHQPETLSEFLQTLYFHKGEYKGLIIGDEYIIFNGFRNNESIPHEICSILADKLIEESLSKKWVKASLHNNRNKKYIMRSWLNSLGFTGTGYEELRRYFVHDLPGVSDRKKV